MNFPSAPNLALLLSMALCVGLLSAWPSTSVTAETACDPVSAADQSSHSSSSTQPCLEQNKVFSLMLPFVFSGGTQDTNPQETVTATAMPTKDSIIEPTATSPSNPLATPTPTAAMTVSPTAISPTTTLPPTETPTDMPTSGELLFDPPSISMLSQAGNTINLAWTGCEDAVAFRVLHGAEGQRPASVETTERAVTIAQGGATGEQTYIVECYDALGNSVFSSPRLLEVAQ